MCSAAENGHQTGAANSFAPPSMSTVRKRGALVTLPNSHASEVASQIAGAIWYIERQARRRRSTYSEFSGPGSHIRAATSETGSNLFKSMVPQTSVSLASSCHCGQVMLPTGLSYALHQF